MTIDEVALSKLLDDVAARLGVAGAQAAVYHRGELVEACSGVSSVATGVEVTPDTLFQVGSTTKVFTAALVMQLVDEGTVEMDTPVGEYLPGATLSSTPSDEPVTPRMLMSMSSGLDNGTYEDHGRGDDAVERYVAAMAQIPAQAQPGMLFGYSNASTVVSGRIVERHAGVSWDDALRERLLEPAGLTQSATFPEDVMVRRFAVGHLPGQDGAPAPIGAWSLPRSIGPAGSTLCASAGDLVRFGRLFLEPNDVVSRESAARMHTPQVDVPATGIASSWCAGPFMKVWDGHEVFGHSGTNMGGSSMLLWAPGAGLAMATVVNTPPRGYPLADAVAAEVFAGAGIRKPPPVAPDESAGFDHDLYHGEYASVAGTFTVTTHDGVLRLRMDSSRGGQTVESDLLPAGNGVFVPTNPAVAGGRGLGVAFVGRPGDRASHFLHFVFLARRVDE